MTTAQRSRLASSRGGVGPLTGTGRSKVTLRTSCCTEPSAAIARITMVFVPSRSLTGAAMATDLFDGRSRSWNTWAPFTRTLTSVTPLLEVATAAATVDSSVRRARSSGWVHRMASSLIAGGGPGAATGGAGAAAGGAAGGTGAPAGGAAGGGAAGGGTGAAAGGGAGAATTGGRSRLITSVLSAGMEEDWILTMRRTSGAYHAVTCHDCAPGTCSPPLNGSPASRFAVYTIGRARNSPPTTRTSSAACTFQDRRTG